MLSFSFVALMAAAAVAGAVVIPKTPSENDDVCPVPVQPMDGFDAQKMFDGKHWFVVGGPASPQLACAYFDVTYNANNNTASFNEYLTYMGRKSESSFVLNSDPKSSAIFSYTDTTHDETIQMAILDTDYVKYALISQCAHGSGIPNSQTVYILSRQVSPPDNFEQLKNEAKNQGYPVDEQHLSPTDTSACPKQ